MELLIKFAAYVPELLMSQIEVIYLYNMNMAFKNYATKLSSSIRIFAHIKVLNLVEVLGAKVLILFVSFVVVVFVCS